jgi:hypothetical protein
LVRDLKRPSIVNAGYVPKPREGIGKCPTPSRGVRPRAFLTRGDSSLRALYIFAVF